MTIKTLALGALLAFLPVTQAQTRISFLMPDAFSDIFVTHQPDTFEYVLALGPNPTVTYAGFTYRVEAVFGLWALSDGSDLLAQGTAQGGWRYDEHSVTLAGWSNPTRSRGVYPLGSRGFTFESIDPAAVAMFGVRVMLVDSLPSGEQMAHFQLVGEPESVAGLLFGLAAATTLRTRRKKP